MAYIEKDLPGTYFNPISSTVEINPVNKSTTENTDTDENLARWDWLISNWANMTFSQRMSLFTPSFHFIDLKDTARASFDQAINDDIIKTSYERCRSMIHVDFDPNRQGIPNILVTFDKINVNAIPDTTIKNEVVTWGKKYGFLDEE